MSNVTETTNSVDELMDAFMGKSSSDPYSFQNEAPDTAPQRVPMPEDVQEEGGFEQSDEGSQDIPIEERIALEEKRRRDFQSKYDKAQSELTRMKEVMPLMEYINGNPSVAKRVYETIEQELSRQGSSDAQAPAESKIEPPEKPKAPEKPRDYDPYDVDASSPSGRYKQEYDAYLSKLDSYYEERREYDIAMTRQQVESAFQPYIQQMEQQRQAQAQQQQMQQIYGSFVESGVNPQEAAGVIQWAQGYQVTPQDVVALYKMKNGIQQQPQRRAPQQVNFPMPASTVGNSSIPQPKAEDQFFEMMLGMEKKNSDF